MPEFDPKTRELLVGMLLMAVLLVVIAVGIRVIAVYRRRVTGDEGDAQAELAESFQEAYEAGEIGTDEYQQIREALARGPARTPPRLAPAPPSEPSNETRDDSGSIEEHPEAPPEAPGSDPEREGRPD